MKEYLVPIRFERKVVVETTIKVAASNALSATAQVQRLIDKQETNLIAKKIDNKDGIYGQFADNAEATVMYGDEIRNISINDDTIEA